MKLVYKRSGSEVKIGDIASTFRGEQVRVSDFTPPHKPSSTGRVYVQFLDSDSDSPVFTREFFPSVIEAEWVI